MWPFGQRSKHALFLKQLKAKIVRGDMDAAYEDAIAMRKKGILAVAQGFAEYDKKYQAFVAKLGNSKDSLTVAGEIDKLEREYDALMGLYEMWR